MKYGRALLQDVEGYVPGEQPRGANIIKLNTNENPYPPAPAVLDAVRTLNADALRKYPDPVALELRTCCAERYGYAGPEWVVCGNGMDELLALAVRTFADPGDRILTASPTYTLYETLTHLHGAELVQVELDDAFELTERFFRTPARLCFLPRPNSPTGVSVPRADVERLCRTFDGLVVVDEAYVDFADDHCMDLPKRFENVIVMRTFSKSFSLAGLRLGAAVAQPEIIAEFLKTKDSYNLNAATQAAGIAAMTHYDAMLDSARRVIATRERLTACLMRLGFTVPPSQANFVLAQWNGTPSARQLFVSLRESGILVRYFSHSRLENALRISVGADEEVDALIQALTGLVA